MIRDWTDPAFERVAQIVHASTGLVYSPTSSLAAEAGTRRAMQRAGVSDVATYLDMLQSGGVQLGDLIDELAVSETFFFRHPARFDFIRRHVLPEIRGRRGENHVVRAWSAGCASGEEPYSLAILCEEEGLADHCRILATDVSRGALDRAREAAYGQISLRAVDQALVRRYFRRVGYREVLHDHIRQRVAFRHLNLASGEYPSLATGTVGLDLILCRNVLIYFDRQTIAQVVRQFYEALADGGWFVTGASDPPLPEDVPFEPMVTPSGVFYRRRARKPAKSVAAGALAVPAGRPFVTDRGH